MSSHGKRLHESARCIVHGFGQPVTALDGDRDILLETPVQVRDAAGRPEDAHVHTEV
jgi:hypothetical protein